VPAQWYERRNIPGDRVRLTRSTGTVHQHHVTTGGADLRFVAKVSRFAQHLDLGELLPARDHGLTPWYNDPFEEFAQVERLRRSRVAPRIYTKPPLAIFSPARRYELWQLGRSQSSLRRHAFSLQHDQCGREAGDIIALDPHRDYISVFGWIVADTLPELVERGLITEEELGQHTQNVLTDLSLHGFHVFDHKPDHVLVRVRRNGSLPFRNGRLVYALADYELLFEVGEGR
jgi:hypothetical protein